MPARQAGKADLLDVARARTIRFGKCTWRFGLVMAAMYHAKKRPPETLTWCHLFHDEADITGGKCSVAWLDQILLPGRGLGLGEAVLWRVARGHAACQ
jgi:hypothetical protein